MMQNSTLRIDLPEEGRKEELISACPQNFWNDLEDLREELPVINTKLAVRMAVRVTALREAGVVLVGYEMSPDNPIRNENGHAHQIPLRDLISDPSDVESGGSTSH